jgi:ribonucleoside-triphosphate reductase
MKVRKSNGTYENFSTRKLTTIIKKVYKSAGIDLGENTIEEIIESLNVFDEIPCTTIRKQLEDRFMQRDEKLYYSYKRVKDKKDAMKDFVEVKKEFINRYKASSNTANATIDDNSNVANKNIAVLNAEIHKPDNIQISRGMVMQKLKELFPDFDEKQYLKDLEHHIIYKHDESSFAGAISPYCCSISLYPFITGGIRGIGGLSAAPKNLDSFCGMYINMLFAVASQFAGAVAVSEFLVFFTWYCKKEWGEDFWKRPDTVISINTGREKTVRSQIHQYWQQIIYSLNQPASARGNQSIFYNQNYFDKPFFEGMFQNFYFPDGTQPDWESTDWIQREFMSWFNEERLRTMLTFPVESFALIYKDGEFVDKESAKFVAEEYARGHSFFTYISDSVDSLSSCCRLKNKVQTKEFNFTNGNMGVETGSKSVITLNLSRIIQDWAKTEEDLKNYNSLKNYLYQILDRVYLYHVTYNELLWDMYDANLLSVYKAGFIDLNKQYLTIGINGLNQSAEFLGISCTDNPEYEKHCQEIFGMIKEFNEAHKGKFNGHQITLNTECVPAESLAIKNYNWDKEDGYWVPEDTNLYASYIYKPNDKKLSVLEKIRLHGSRYIGDYLDGGSAAHINLSEHLSTEQYERLIKYAADEGCQYFTWNIPNCECDECGYIAKQPFKKCPKCESTHVSLWDRIIGYLTRIDNWSEGRQIEQKTRVYSKTNNIEDIND